MGKVNTSFGDYLRGIRNKRRETLADVSGAVEIDVMMLDRIESGSLQPSEDMLMLLISHYNLKEDEAISINLQILEAGETNKNEKKNNRQCMMMATRLL